MRLFKESCRTLAIGIIGIITLAIGIIAETKQISRIKKKVMKLLDEVYL